MQAQTIESSEPLAFEPLPDEDSVENASAAMKDALNDLSSQLMWMHKEKRRLLDYIQDLPSAKNLARGNETFYDSSATAAIAVMRYQQRQLDLYAEMTARFVRRFGVATNPSHNSLGDLGSVLVALSHVPPVGVASEVTDVSADAGADSASE